jgi:hypothetical protein
MRSRRDGRPAAGWSRDGGNEIAGEGKFAVVLPAQGDSEGAVGAGGGANVG